MKTTQSFILLLLTGLFFIACGSPESSQKDEEMSQDSTEESATDMDSADDMASTPIGLIVTHEVEDYEKWKAKFDEHASARNEAQLSDWALLRGRDNPNMVTVIGKVGDIDAAKAFIASEDLKSVMEGAGVKGEPNIRFAKVEVLDQEAAKSSNVRLYTQHKVKDYAAWKSVFDSKAEMHQEAGVSAVAIGRDMDDENDITVVLTAADFETLENFIKNPELKAAMEQAGVMGEPNFSFMNIQSLQF